VTARDMSDVTRRSLSEDMAELYDQHEGRSGNGSSCLV
jgi:hypothetical protein